MSGDRRTLSSVEARPAVEEFYAMIGLCFCSRARAIHALAIAQPQRQRLSVIELANFQTA